MLTMCNSINIENEKYIELSDPYFKSLFEAADKSFISEASLKLPAVNQS